MDHNTIERDSVIERYVTGKLGAEESAAFEEHYLDCEQCIEQVEAAERLQRGLGKVAEEEATKALRRGLMISLVAWTRRNGGLLLIALAVLILPLLQQRTISSLSGDLESARRQLSAATVEPRINARVFSLSPFRDVGLGDPPAHRLSVADGAWLVLSLEVGAQAPSYNASLLRKGDEIWRGVGLEPGSTGAVTITFPPGFLAAGSYLLELDPGVAGTLVRFALEVRRPE